MKQDDFNNNSDLKPYTQYPDPQFTTFNPQDCKSAFSKPNPPNQTNNNLITESNVSYNGLEAARHLKRIRTLKKIEKKKYLPKIRNKLILYTKLSPKTIAENINDCYQIADFPLPTWQFYVPPVLGSDYTPFRPFFSLMKFKRIYKSECHRASFTWKLFLVERWDNHQKYLENVELTKVISFLNSVADQRFNCLSE